MLRVFDPHQLKDLMCKKVSAEEQVLESVKQILADVRLRGLEAVIEYTKKYDGVLFEDSQIIVSQDEFDRAYACVEKDFLISLKKAMQRIIYFHQKQKRVSWLERDEDGNLLGQINNPISRVGVYVPGGTAAYPSSVLMNVIPAKVAGVSEIIMVTPADANGSVNAHTLVAAKEAGVDLIYKVGGAQAIAWLAYGGEGFESVDIITGPGNAYVAQAKRLVTTSTG